MLRLPIATLRMAFGGFATAAMARTGSASFESILILVSLLCINLEKKL
jgi:hypothetical protein